VTDDNRLDQKAKEELERQGVEGHARAQLRAEIRPLLATSVSYYTAVSPIPQTPEPVGKL